MKKGRLLMNMAVAGVVAAAAMSCSHKEESHSHHGHSHGKKVKCFGANSCKGKGACGEYDPSTGKFTSACNGQNSCKGKSFVKLSKEACLEQGGKLSAVRN